MHERIGMDQVKYFRCFKEEVNTLLEIVKYRVHCSCSKINFHYHNLLQNLIQRQFIFIINI